MKTLRNLALAGILAVGAALASSGSANAFGGYYPGYGYGYGQSRLCYVPFFKLVQWFGYWQAKRIKARCFYRPFYYY
jgi:hypothetical protein